MSTLIALRRDGATVLATDSIMYDQQERIMGLRQQKIYAISPDVFFGWSGRRSLAAAMANIAAALSRTALPGNLPAFVEQLNAAAQAPIILEAKRNLAEQVNPAVAGELPMFLYILAGVSDGVPGFIACEMWLKNGGVEFKSTGAGGFRPTTELQHYMTGAELVDLVNDPNTWEDELDTIAERFVDHLRITTPAYFGGPTQLAHINKLGGRWVREPVELDFWFRGSPTPPWLDGIGGVKAKLRSGSPLSVDTSGNLIVKQGAGVGTDGSGNLVVKTSSTIGTDGSGNVIIPALAVQTANLAAGSLGDLSKYSSSVRAVTIVYGLPSLPNTAYPTGAMIMNTADGKVYRTTNGTTWDTKSAPADLFTGTLAAGVVYAGTVAATNVTAGSLYGFTITGSSLVLTSGGITTSINNASIGGTVG